jgi:hypothetical protein
MLGAQSSKETTLGGGIKDSMKVVKRIFISNHGFQTQKGTNIFAFQQTL